MPIKNLEQEGTQLILNTTGVICSNTREIVSSDIFEDVIARFSRSLVKHGSPLLERLKLDLSQQAGVDHLVAIVRTLSVNTVEQLVKLLPDTDHLLNEREALHQLIEELYDFWRNFDRFMVCHSQEGPESHDLRPYRTFNSTVENLGHLIRALYRDVCENITGDHPTVYRQVTAGCNVGLIAVEMNWPCPSEYAELLGKIPIIRQMLLNPPLILRPPMNKRTGEFQRVDTNPLEGLSVNKDEWLCYPAQVGPLVIFAYIHQKFIGLGCTLCNLFELATDEQIAKGPDAIYMFGAPPESMARYGDLPTVFYDDEANGILTAAIPCEDRFGYFGYIKKMMLTLHNVVMIKRGHMPFHGAMVRIELKSGAAANVLLLGDTATGKSESIEAFRVLGDEHLRQLTIVADDMGTIDVTEDGLLRGYGTEIGAFIRLDDLQHGYAFNQIDRAIFHNPHLINARVILPVTTLAEVLRGYPIDFILYANNYEQVDEKHPIIERLTSAEEALDVFRSGKAMGKGTTTSTGLTQTYFANIFGPAQYQAEHDVLAAKVFKAAFDTGVFVGQMRTRLGIDGFEAKGPQEAAQALFELILESK